MNKLIAHRSPKELAGSTCLELRPQALALCRGMAGVCLRLAGRRSSLVRYVQTRSPTHMNQRTLKRGQQSSAWVGSGYLELSPQAFDLCLGVAGICLRLAGARFSLVSPALGGSRPLLGS